MGTVTSLAGEATDYTTLLAEIISRLDGLTAYSHSIYVVIIGLVVLGVGAFIVYLMLRPIMYFFY